MRFQSQKSWFFWYSTLNMAQWSTTVASQEATKCCHRASACAVLPRWPPWSSSLVWEKTIHTTYILPSNYCTFFLVVCKKFVIQNRPSTQHINATSFVKRAEKLVSKFDLWGVATDFAPPWISWDIHATIQQKHSVSDQVYIPSAVNFHSCCVVSIKIFSNLLCNYHISLQFSYQFAILIFGVEFLRGHLQFSYQIAIFIWVCNSHVTTPALT